MSYCRPAHPLGTVVVQEELRNPATRDCNTWNNSLILTSKSFWCAKSAIRKCPLSSPAIGRNITSRMLPTMRNLTSVLFVPKRSSRSPPCANMCSRNTRNNRLNPPLIAHSINRLKMNPTFTCEISCFVFA